MAFLLSRRKQGRNILYFYKKSRCTTVNSHVNGSKSNNLITSSSDIVIVNSNLPRVNVQTEGSFNTLVILKNKLIQSQVLVLMNK